MYKLKQLLIGSALLVAAFSASPCWADTLDFIGPSTIKGTGIGAALTIMTLHQQGSGTMEGGSVSWNGTTDVISANPTGSIQTGGSQTQTITVASLLADSITSLAVVLQVNTSDPNSSTTNLQIGNFSLTFFDAQGHSLGSADFTGTESLAGVGTGTSGYLFTIDPANIAAVTALYGNTANRVGITVDPAFSNATDGNDTFFLVNDPNGNPFVQTPLPSSLALLGSLVMPGLGFFWYRWRFALSAAR
jgi:hypothetical protein